MFFGHVLAERNDFGALSLRLRVVVALRLVLVPGCLGVVTVFVVVLGDTQAEAVFIGGVELSFVGLIPKIFEYDFDWQYFVVGLRFHMEIIIICSSYRYINLMPTLYYLAII